MGGNTALSTSNTGASIGLMFDDMCASLGILKALKATLA
jgi:hypothetical protein